MSFLLVVGLVLILVLVAGAVGFLLIRPREPVSDNPYAGSGTQEGYRDTPSARDPGVANVAEVGERDDAARAERPWRGSLNS